MSYKKREQRLQTIERAIWQIHKRLEEKEMSVWSKIKRYLKKNNNIKKN